MNKLTIIVEDDGMDSGCVYAILQECINHGRVLEANLSGVNLKGEPYFNGVMHFLEGMEPEEGKC